MTGIEGLNVQEVQENEVKLPKLEITTYQDFKDKFDDAFLDDIKNGDIQIYKMNANPNKEEEEEDEEGQEGKKEKKNKKNAPKFTPTEDNNKKELYYVFQRKGLGRDFRVKENDLKSFLQMEQTKNEKDALLEEVLLKTNIDVQKNDIRKEAADKLYNEYVTENKKIKEVKKEEEEKITTEVKQELKETLPAEIKTNADLLLAIEALIADLERFAEEDVTLGKINNPLNAYSKEAKSEFKVLRTEAKTRLAKMKKLKKELEEMNAQEAKMTPNMNNLERVKRYQNDVKDMKNTYIGKAIFGNVSMTRTDIDTRKEAERAIEYQLDLVKYNAEMNMLLQEGDLALLLNEDLQGFRSYLRDIAEGRITDLENNPFALKNPLNVKLLINHILSFPQKYPYFYMCIMRVRRVTITTSGTPESEIQLGGGSVFDKGGNLFAEGLQKLGIIDKNDPTKKEAWAKFGKVGLMIGAVALGIKIIRKLFSKDKDKWTWVGGGVLGLVALNNVDGLQNWFKAAFGKKNPTQEEIEHMTNVDSSPEYVNNVPPVITTMQTVGGVPIKTLVDGNYIVERDGKLTLDYPAYQTYIENSALTLEEKTQILAGLEKAKKDNTVITRGLELLNINTISDLKDLAGNDDKKTLTDVDNLGTFFLNLSSELNSDLKKRKLKAKDSATWYIINKEYAAKGTFTDQRIEELKSQGLLVEDAGVEAETNKTNIARWSKFKPEVVKDITLADAVKELQSKGIEATLSGDKIISYGKEIVIDPAKKQIKSLDITFKNNADLVGAASFINFVRFSTENSKPKDANPFNIKLDGSLYFNDSDWYDITSTDTKIVNAGFTSTLDKISPSLDNNKDTFKNYLNKTRLWVKNTLEREKNEIFNDVVARESSWLNLIPEDKQAVLGTNKPGNVLTESFKYTFPSNDDIMDINKPYKVGVTSKGANTPVVINRTSDINRIDNLNITFSDYGDLVKGALFVNTCIKSAKSQFARFVPYSESPFVYNNGQLSVLKQTGTNVEYSPLNSLENSPISEGNASAFVQYLNDRYKANKREFGTL